MGFQMAVAKGINVIRIDPRDEGIALSDEAGCEHVSMQDGAKKRK